MSTRATQQHYPASTSRGTSAMRTSAAVAPSSSTGVNVPRTLPIRVGQTVNGGQSKKSLLPQKNNYNSVSNGAGAVVSGEKAPAQKSVVAKALPLTVNEEKVATRKEAQTAAERGATRRMSASRRTENDETVEERVRGTSAARREAEKPLPSASVVRNGTKSAKARVSDSSSDDSDTEVGDTPVVRESEYQKLAQGGRCGLRNLGNTCFMNSVIQCLSNTRPLLEYVLAGAFKKDLQIAARGSNKRKSDFILTYANMIEALWRRRSAGGMTDAFSPSEFKRQVERLNRQFIGSGQHDAQELLRYVLQGLHEDINRVPERPRRDAAALARFEEEYERVQSDEEKADVAWGFYRRFENSAVVDMFVGQLKSTLDFTDCGHKSVTFDPFWDLSLPIPRRSASSSLSLEDCMQAFVASETLDGDERPKCERCQQRRRCTKSLSIHRFPRILVIHLKRFSGEHWRSTKVNTLVNFPVTDFNMTPYAAPRSSRTRYIYNLYGISNHSGSMEFGHYVASCRHPFASGDEWNCFDDSRVSSIGSSLVSSQAYVLFYELRNGKDDRD